MNALRFFAGLRAHSPHEPALIGSRAALAYGALLDEVDALAEELLRRRVRILATRLPNGPAWIVADLAALRAGIVHVPLPSFFTDEQLEHALRAAGADAELLPATRRSAAGEEVAVTGDRLALIRRVATPPELPSGTRKITFTSGTTAAPKGVCLGESMLTVADALVQALAPTDIRRHLCALPLPVLLENIAGVYAPLLAGATVVVANPDEVGLRGSSSFLPSALDAAVRRHRADSAIVLPQMLRAWTAWRAAVAADPQPTLKFVAVGGAKVGAVTMARARLAGLPAYEGYGLSEAASVQTLNLPQADRPGSAGKALPHVRVRVDDEGQVWIAGALMLGHLGAAASTAPAWWPTGDLGRLDADGFLHIDGRRDDVLVTSFGRNVSPEWIESELQASPAIAHAVVFGDGAPRPSAVLWPARDGTSDCDLALAIAQANARLPDYARVAQWVRALAPFTAAAGMATANGRPKRSVVAQAHRDARDAVFDDEVLPLVETHVLSRPTAGLDR